MVEALVFLIFHIRVLFLIHVFQSFVFGVARTVDGGWDGRGRAREGDGDGDGTVCTVMVATDIDRSSRCRKKR